jgi:large subunit ribosomal protein L21
VVGTLESTYRGKKILIKKFRRRKGYRLKKGHRQDYSTVRITQVVAG